ncbi:hypothetical protein ACFWHR_08115 [Leucobacter sp. NPDC058333]|uniref:hypothetical protein n=1 Tax=Leucobacter sp. NPDC058333 TaxID=3346450 RepID=UPI00365701B5
MHQAIDQLASTGSSGFMTLMIVAAVLIVLAIALIVFSAVRRRRRAAEADASAVDISSPTDPSNPPAP